ncbi:Acb2/Tad1 domain-containing protein [Nevskia sp.]|uniref:Acb2/Tad1 domain-containing protein n=1 Tax=Nevskia sp. TaxID=1929292 RepID=UPI003F6F3B96
MTSKENVSMETITQPKITGYRQLNEAEAALMNEIKARGVELGELVNKLRTTAGLDQRWISIGSTDLQTGLMALVRGVAQPTTF